PPLEDLQAPYAFYHKSLFDFLDDISRSGPFYLGYRLRSDFVCEKYMAVVRDKCFKLGEADQSLLSRYFHFRLFPPAPFYMTGPSMSDFDLPAANVEWWVRATAFHRNSQSLDYAFNGVHASCQWFRCTPLCKRWQSIILRVCRSENWQVPSAVRLLLIRFNKSKHTPFYPPQNTRNLCSCRQNVL
ncbi:hypothetical protein EST38_g4978, partial [Candolleomyces aberdarensis]